VFAFAPIFVANVVFSRSFRDTSEADSAFASNLLGIAVGGVVEYAALATGYQALLIPVMVFLRRRAGLRPPALRAGPVTADEPPNPYAPDRRAPARLTPANAGEKPVGPLGADRARDHRATRCRVPAFTARRTARASPAGSPPRWRPGS
jgi:hypothetical protein